VPLKPPQVTDPTADPPQLYELALEVDVGKNKTKIIAKIVPPKTNLCMGQLFRKNL